MLPHCQMAWSPDLGSQAPPTGAYLLLEVGLRLLTLPSCKNIWMFAQVLRPAQNPSCLMISGLFLIFLLLEILES